MISAARQLEHRSTPRGGWLRGRGLAIGIGLAAVAAAVYFYCVSRVDRQLRQYVEDKFNSHYAPKNLRVTVGSARLVEGQGVDIRDLIFFEAEGSEDKPIVVMGQLFVENRATLRDLVSTVPPPERVYVRNMKLRATRMADGTWDAMRLFPPPKFGDFVAPTYIENSTLELVDPANRPASSLVLRDVHVNVEPQYKVGATQSLPVHIRGEFSSRFSAQSKIDAYFDSATGEWRTAGAVARLEISPELRAALPKDLAQPLAAIAGFRSEASLHFRLAGNKKSAAAPEFAVWGGIRRGVLEDPRLPRPLTDISCELYCDNLGVSLKELTAKIGAAEIRGDGQQQGWTKGSPLELTARATQLSLDDLALYQAMPEPLRERCDDFDPRGVVDVDLRLAFDGQKWMPDITVDCRDVSFAHRSFRYRLSGAVGRLTLKEDLLEIHLIAQAEGGPVRIEGKIVEPGPNYTGWVEVNCEKPVPISSSLVDALPQKTQDIVRSLRLGGEATVLARVERPDPRMEKPHWHLRIDLHECSIKYAKFPYPLNRIGGILECRDGDWKFRELYGYNGSAYVTCQGGWTPGDRKQPLWFDFVAADVPLDEELRRALSPGAQKLWSSLRPRGTIDELKIGLRYFANRQKLSIDVDAQKRPTAQNIEGRSLAVEPQWLPYRLDDITGSVRYRDGVIELGDELTDVEGFHGRTRVRSKGEIHIAPDGGWSAQFRDIVADRLYADHDLISALPPSMSQAVEKLRLSGPARVFGNFSVVKGGFAEAPLQADWDITVDAVGAGVDCGVPLESIQGGVRLAGRFDETGLKCRGELDVESLMVNGQQITDISGPVWIDETKMLLGAWAEPAQKPGPPRRLSGRLLDGSLSVDAQVMLNPDRDFRVHADFHNGNLATIAREFTSMQRRISGAAHASVQLQGSRKGRHTWRGGGNVWLREANIYELPVMVSLLKVLSARDPDVTAFTTSDIVFRIQDEIAYLDKIDFKGDAISLKGKGEVNLAGGLNVNFYTLLGRDELWAPVVTYVWGEASQQVLLIRARGTLQAPEVTREAFPAVNDALANMFPELARRLEKK